MIAGKEIVHLLINMVFFLIDIANCIMVDGYDIFMYVISEVWYLVLSTLLLAICLPIIRPSVRKYAVTAIVTLIAALLCRYFYTEWVECNYFR